MHVINGVVVNKYFLVLSFLSLFIAGCTGELDSKAALKETKANLNETKADSNENKIAFEIRSEETLRNIKRVVEVNLSERLNEQDIKSIANEIKDQDKNKYDRTFILFFIPEWAGSAWATATFDPDLVVNIIGSSLTDHNKLKNKEFKTDGEIIGHWIANWGFEYKVFFTKKNGQVFQHRIFSDGESAAEVMNIIKKNGQKAYQDESGKDHGEYFIINKDGDLEYWSSNGNFYTAKRIE